jgi:hypothetical protein
LLTGAHSYFCAARQLRRSGLWKSNPTLIQRPTLHLLCHGIELLLKANLVRGGLGTEEVRRGFGHNLERLWDAQENACLKDALNHAAEKVWQRAMASGKWRDDDFSDDPKLVLDKAIRDLSILHTDKSEYALRYIIKQSMTAPRPMFPLEVFAPFVARLVRNPLVDWGV